MPNYQHPYNYAQYTQPVYNQPVYTPDFHAGQVSPNQQVPFPAFNGGQLATPLPRPKHVSRYTNTTNEPFPSKSALKNGYTTTAPRTENGIPVNAQAQVTRRRSKPTRAREDSRGRNSEQTLTAGQHRNSSNSSRRADRSISRQRTNSKTRFIPGNLDPSTGINISMAYISTCRSHIPLLQERQRNPRSKSFRKRLD